MNTRLNVIVRGVREVKQRLIDLKNRVQDWTPLNDKVHELLMTRMARNFETEGRSEGNPWPGYGAEPKYAAYKRAITGHNKLLRWDAKAGYEMLYPSLTTATHASHIWNQPGKRTFEYGTSVDHASHIEQDHQGPFGEISAAREFSYIGRTTEDMITEAVVKWILIGDLS